MKQKCICNLGDIAYIIESKRFIREVKIINRTGDFYTVRFTGGDGAIRIRGNRLFPTEKEAKALLPKKDYIRPWHPY